MGILDRVGQIFKSYWYSDDNPVFKGTVRGNDPDFNAAYEELNDFLNKDKAGTNDAKFDFSGNKTETKAEPRQKSAVPESLRPDFAELEVSFGASAQECKEAYKKLLKIHHPDKHANHEGNFKKATNKTARINAAYGRINKWWNAADL